MVQKEDLQALVAIIYILAENLQTICDSLPSETAKEPEKTPAKVKKISLEEVRGKLAEISQSGKTAAVRELIQKHGFKTTAFYLLHKCVGNLHRFE